MAKSQSLYGTTPEYTLSPDKFNKQENIPKLHFMFRLLKGIAKYLDKL